jgi:hypothetical protein
MDGQKIEKQNSDYGNPERRDSLNWQYNDGSRMVNQYMDQRGNMKMGNGAPVQHIEY